MSDTSVVIKAKSPIDWNHIIIAGLTMVAAAAIPTALHYIQDLPWATIAPAYAPAIGTALTIINEFVTTQLKVTS